MCICVSCEGCGGEGGEGVMIVAARGESNTNCIAVEGN